MKTLQQQLAEHPLFKDNQPAWQSIYLHISAKTTQKDQVIAYHGDSAHTLWIISSGWVKLSRQTPDGKETIVGLCTDGNILGEAALFSNASYPHTIETLSNDTHLICIQGHAIRLAISQSNELSAHIMSLFNQQMAQTQLKLEHMNTLSAAQRLGCFLLRLCKTQQTGEFTIHIPFEKHIVASYLGMKPETFSRSLNHLKTIGIRVSGHDVHINHVGDLREFVCNSCSELGACDTEEHESSLLI